MLFFGVGASAQEVRQEVKQDLVADDADEFFFEAQRQQLLGHNDDAFELLTHSLELNPQSPPTLYELAMSYVRLRQDSTAINMMKKAVEMAPDNYWYKDALVNLYASTNKIDDALKVLEKISGAGIRAILLFGVPAHKDEVGSAAYDEDGIVPRAIRAIKAKCPDLVVIADVCLCEYTSHGHCGLVKDGVILNDETLPLLAKASVAYARAGADIVAPSDMMDGRVGAIRAALDALDPAADDHNAIIMISDGGDLRGEAIQNAQLAAKRKIPIFTVGIGDPKHGAPIPSADGRGEMKHQGQTVKVKLEEAALKAISEASKGRYVPLATAAQSARRSRSRAPPRWTMNSEDGKTKLERMRSISRCAFSAARP